MNQADQIYALVTHAGRNELGITSYPQQLSFELASQAESVGRERSVVVYCR
jgi:hypothetical protein